MDFSASQLFQKRTDPIDWKKFACVDVDRVARDVDVDAIQENIYNVTYCDIQHELGQQVVDPNFLKLFRLAQLTIEYLLHCQDYLQGCLVERDQQLTDAEAGMRATTVEQETLRSELTARNEAYKNLKKELGKCKKLIADYQLMVRAGAGGLHKCAFCQKSFVNETFLRSHMERRHPSQSPAKPSITIQPVAVDQSSANQIQANLEATIGGKLLTELNEIRSRLQTTEDNLGTERSQHESARDKESAQHVAMLEQIREAHTEDRREAELKFAEEMEGYKRMMMTELRNTQDEKMKLEEALREQMQNKRTGLGELVDVTAEDSADRTQKIAELYTKMNRLEERSVESARLSEAEAKKREKAMKLQYDKKLTDAYAKIEEATLGRQKEQQVIEKLRSQIEVNRQSVETIKHDSPQRKVSIPPIPAPRSPRSLDPPPPPPPVPERDISTEQVMQLGEGDEESDDSGDVNQESLCHWVSANGESHRVLRQPSAEGSEWRDLFTFFAPKNPVGTFNNAVFVYSCGGSPYWRQYVSSSATPPRPNYKLDYAFYAASEKLLGTVRLNVLDAGSGSVVKSIVTKQQSISGWKEKALSFYAFKSGPSDGMNQSVTINSHENEARSASRDKSVTEFEGTGTGEDEDVSVSSWSDTDDVKKNLAQAINRTRSQENLLDGTDGKEEKEASEEEQDEEEVEEEEEEEESLMSERMSGTANMNASSSASLWESADFEAGEYFPFPGNDLARALYNHKQETIDDQRDQIIEILRDSLDRRGVDCDEPRMPAKQLAAKLKVHENEVKTFAAKYVGFAQQRDELLTQIELSAEQKCKKRKRPAAGGGTSISKFQKAGSILKHAASAVKKLGSSSGSAGGNNLTASGKSTLTNGTESSFGTLSGRSALQNSGALSSTAASDDYDTMRSADSAESEEEEEEEEVSVDIHAMPRRTTSAPQQESTPMRDSGRGTNASVPVPQPRRQPTLDASAPTKLPRQTGSMENLDQSEELSDESEWDSDVSGAGNAEMVPRVSVRKPTIDEDDRFDDDSPEPPYEPQMRKPQGAKVKELTASLEMSLNKRGVNKPAGSVDLTRSMEAQGDDQAKRHVQFKDSPRGEDDDDFSLTDLTKPGKSLDASLIRKDDFMDDWDEDDEDENDDIDNLLASYDHGRSGMKFSTPKAQPTAMTTFNDDFDDSGELSMDELR